MKMKPIISEGLFCVDTTGEEHRAMRIETDRLMIRDLEQADKERLF